MRTGTGAIMNRQGKVSSIFSKKGAESVKDEAKIVVALHYPSNKVDAVLNAAKQLPPWLRPTHYGHDEGVKNDLDVVSSENRFKAFLNEATSGFFLYAEQTTYNVSVANGKETQLFIECVNSDDAGRLIRTLGLAGAEFGYAADFAEVKHRNRLVKKIEHGVHEAWVGRDWRRYLPGVYWLTLVSERLANSHGIPMNRLTGAAIHAEKLGPDLVLLQFFDVPEDWGAHKAELDGLCTQTTGVFSIDQVKPEFDKAKTFLETVAVLSKWK